MTDAKRFHEESIVIDATCPLVATERYLDNYREGGVTAVAATVGFGMPDLGTIQYTIRNLGEWFDRLRRKDTLLHVASVDDIYRAKREKKLGVIFHFQSSLPYEDDPNTVEIYYRLGIRMCLLCYNAKDRVGCGCAVEPDTGLTEFGAKLIGEMNRLGMVVDCAHTGYRTSMDAIACSTQPVIISHGNAKAVHNSKRNLPDDLIKAIAANGGVVGLNGYPAFVADKPRPGLDDYLDHVEYVAKLAGIDHVCLGLDYYQFQAGVIDDATAQASYDYLIQTGAWTPDVYPPPPWFYPVGIEMPEKFGNLTAGLLRRGFSESDTEKILGLNLIRVFREVWGR
jgi:membrane dipeptidase